MPQIHLNISHLEKRYYKILALWKLAPWNMGIVPWNSGTMKYRHPEVPATSNTITLKYQHPGILDTQNIGILIVSHYALMQSWQVNFCMSAKWDALGTQKYRHPEIPASWNTGTPMLMWCASQYVHSPCIHQQNFGLLQWSNAATQIAITKLFWPQNYWVSARCVAEICFAANLGWNKPRVWGLK